GRDRGHAARGGGKKERVGEGKAAPQSPQQRPAQARSSARQVEARRPDPRAQARLCSLLHRLLFAATPLTQIPPRMLYNGAAMSVSSPPPCAEGLGVGVVV